MKQREKIIKWQEKDHRYTVRRELNQWHCIRDGRYIPLSTAKASYKRTHIKGKTQELRF